MRWKPSILLGASNQRSKTVTARNYCSRSTDFWVLTFFAFFYFAAYRYCVYASARDPTSLFFNPAKGYARRYSAKREREAEAFISAANASTSEIGPQPGPLICIGVPTFKRRHKQYVRNTIGSLLEGLSDSQRRSVHLTVLIAQTDTHLHPIYQESWLRKLANQVIKYEVSESEIERLRALETNHKVWEKTMFDYEYLLQDCLKTGAHWIMTVEDDVLAVSGWFPRAKTAFEAIAKHTGNDRDWLYLRLFYTEKFFGWNKEDWATYLGWSIFTFLALLIVLLSSRACSRRLRKTLSNLTIALLCCGCLPLCILLYFASGKVTMQPLATGLRRMEEFACCAQGFIYPRKVVPQVIDRIRAAKTRGGTLDMNLERWADEEHWARYALIPPLLQDVGSDQEKDSHEPDNWNFAFENYT